MATYYLVDGARVRTLESTMNGANLHKLYCWAKVDATKRAVYSESKGLWYRAKQNAWDRGSKIEPKAITMSRMVEAITKTSWQEIQSEIPSDTF